MVLFWPTLYVLTSHSFSRLISVGARVQSAYPRYQRLSSFFLWKNFFSPFVSVISLNFADLDTLRRIIISLFCFQPRMGSRYFARVAFFFVCLLLRWGKKSQNVKFKTKLDLTALLLSFVVQLRVGATPGSSKYCRCKITLLKKVFRYVDHPLHRRVFKRNSFSGPL